MNVSLISPFLSSFGRNRGRSLRPHQQSLVDELLPRLMIDLHFNSPLEGEPESGSDPVGGKYSAQESPHGIAFAMPATPQGGSYASIALEIGFGGGEHLLAQAAHHPDTLFIGCEPFINGVAKCLAGIEAQKLSNIRLFTNDARLLLQALPEHYLDSVFILFPDPWPKARHNKRRLINHETLGMLARAHKPGGRLLMATDHADYSVWILQHLQATPHYRWMAERADDFRNPPADWTQTKYQRKTTAEGRAPVFLECVRN